MQRNNTPVLLITIVLGVLALGATLYLMMGRSAGPGPGPSPEAAAPTPVPAARWVAINDIPPRTTVDSTMLRRVTEAGAAPADAITSFDQLRGQITKERIRRGETVLLSSFNPSLQRKVPANIEIPTGYRAVAIWVDPAQTAAGLVDVGDRVDVIANHKLQYDKAPRQFIIGAQQFTAARTIAQNLLVLGVDESIKAPAPTPTPVPGAAAEAPGPPPPPTPVPVAGSNTRIRVLLAAPPEIASRLVAANDQGVLHVTIRNPNDGDQAPLPETREYPSRLFTAAPDKTTTSVAKSVTDTYKSFTKEMSDTYKQSLGVGSNQPNMPPVQPVQPTTGTDTSIPVPDEKEITVVRGTEKTRVLVPRR